MRYPATNYLAPLMVATMLAVLLAYSIANPTEKPKAKTRPERIAEALQTKASVRVHKLNGNQMLVVDTPTVDKYGYVDVRRCFVWRDAEFKTSSMQCPSYEALPISDPS